MVRCSEMENGLSIFVNMSTLDAVSQTRQVRSADEGERLLHSHNGLSAGEFLFL